MAEREKDKWDKVDILLKPVGGLLTALAVAALGFFGSKVLEDRQLIESKTQLYAQLMSQREEADSALRKDMFNSIINTFLKPLAEGGSDNLTLKEFERKVLALELLAHNFHDALDLAPLFKQVSKDLNSAARDENSEVSVILDRLEKVAKEVTRKQIAVLEESGGKLDGTIDLDELKGHPEGSKVIDGSLELYSMGMGDSEPEIRERQFEVHALLTDEKRKEVRIQLEVTTPKQDGEDADMLHAVFWLGFFDFPMIDNTRLSEGDRCAVVLKKFDESSAEITLVYFPGSRASLKEKPYYDEVLQELLRRKKKT